MQKAGVQKAMTGRTKGPFGQWRLALAACAGSAVAALVLACVPADAAAPVLPAPKPGQSAAPPAGSPGGSSNGSDKPSVLPAIPDKAVPSPGGDDGDAHHNTDDPHNHGGKDKVFQTVDLPSRPALLLSGKAGWDDGLKEINAGIARLRAELARLGLQAGGRPLAIFIESDDETFRYQVLQPLAKAPDKPVEYSDGIRLGFNPGGKVIKFEHRGPYNAIEDTYSAITTYLDEKSLAAREFFIEEFVKDATSPDDKNGAVNIYVFLRD